MSRTSKVEFAFVKVCAAHDALVKIFLSEQMMLDYEEQLCQVVENNPIIEMPQQQFIDASARMAKALWNSFYCAHAQDDEDNWDIAVWYEEAQWSKVLHKYRCDPAFWQSIVDEGGPGMHRLAQALELEQFLNDFPHVVHYVLESNACMEKLFLATHNSRFFNALDVSEEQQRQIYQKYLLQPHVALSKEDVKNHEEDPAFVKALLEDKPWSFIHLNAKNKANEQYITLALRHKEVFFHIPKDKQVLFAKQWEKIHRDTLKLDDIRLMSMDSQAVVIERHPDFLYSLLTSNRQHYEPLAIALLEKDLLQHISLFNKTELKEISQSKELWNKLRPKLQEFVDNVGYDAMNPRHEHELAIFLCCLDTALKKTLQENIFYQIGQKSHASKPWFMQTAKEVLELNKQGKLSRFKTKMALKKIVESLSQEDRSELHIPPEDITGYLTKYVLAVKLDSHLDCPKRAKQKMKL